MARPASSRKGAAGKPARKRLLEVTKPVAKKPVRSATRVVPAAHEAPGSPAAPSAISMRVNGQTHTFEVGRDLTPSMTLSWVLREKLGLTGLKVSCDEGACGACTILLDGKAVLSCMVLAVEASGRDILTIEGLARADPVVEAFTCQCEPGYGTALQCGICTPGFVMAARALLDENPRPTMDEVKEALSGNLCRCGCYAAIAQAVQHASERTVARGGGR